VGVHRRVIPSTLPLADDDIRDEASRMQLACRHLQQAPASNPERAAGGPARNRGFRYLLPENPGRAPRYFFTVAGFGFGVNNVTTLTAVETSVVDAAP
jgi:hypothetical protein